MNDTPDDLTPDGSDESQWTEDSLFPEVSPLSRMPATLKKATAAIHMYPVQGNYGQMDRRVFNALLAISLRKWNMLSAEQQAEIYDKRMVRQFTASIKELKVLLGFKSSDRGYERIYEAIDTLYKLEFRFDVMDDLEQSWTVKSRLVSQWARRNDGSGLVRWEYPPDVFQMLMKPLPFSRVSLALINALKSHYATALYENTSRYVNSPSKLTKRMSVDKWRLLVATGDSETYKEYRYFKRYVLKTSIEMLNKFPECPIELELIETKGSRGRVTHLQFKVQLKSQLPLPTELGRQPDPRIAARIRTLGISERKLNELYLNMDEVDLLMCLDLTDNAVKKGGISNPAGFFIHQCNKLLNIPDTEDPALPAPVQTAVEIEKVKSVRDMGDALKSLPLQRQEELLQEFKSHGNIPDFMTKVIDAKGLNSSMVRGNLVDWLLKAHPELLELSKDD